MISRFFYSSPLGRIVLLSDEEKLIRLTFHSERIDESIPVNESEVIRRTEILLARYFSHLDPVFDIPIETGGTPFQREVWEILRTIPYGRTMTYGEIASVIASRRGIGKMSAQAVGGAVGSNPLPIIIPCHRVLGKGGALVGFGEGLERKMGLLDIEGIPYRK